jgi:predicted kinase
MPSSDDYYREQARNRVCSPERIAPILSDNPVMESLKRGGKLIIVCGLPGSGKTTYARNIQAKLHGIRFSPVEWMDALAINLWDAEKREKIETLQWQFGQELLGMGLAVIIEWGTWGRSERDALRLRARELGATVELHYLAAPVEVLFERIRHRGMENPAMTREQLLQCVEAFQAPTPEELALFDNSVTV